MYEVMADMDEFKEWRNAFTKTADDMRNHTKNRDSQLAAADAEE